jgi:hypothetical protein
VNFCFPLYFKKGMSIPFSVSNSIPMRKTFLNSAIHRNTIFHRSIIRSKNGVSNIQLIRLAASDKLRFPLNLNTSQFAETELLNEKKNFYTELSNTTTLCVITLGKDKRYNLQLFVNTSSLTALVLVDEKPDTNDFSSLGILLPTVNPKYNHGIIKTKYDIHNFERLMKKFKLNAENLNFQSFATTIQNNTNSQANAMKSNAVSKLMRAGRGVRRVIQRTVLGKSTSMSVRPQKRQPSKQQSGQERLEYDPFRLANENNNFILSSAQ